MPFKLTDQVEWTSQPGGHTTTKRGTIIAIVPPKTQPRIPEGYPTGTASSFGRFCVAGVNIIVGMARRHESYLVAVKRKVYWPLVTHLRLSEESLTEVDRLIEDMIAAYPKLFISRTEALHHLFIVLGCGYEWKDGRLFSGTSFPPDEIPRSAAKILAQHRARIEHPYPWTDQCNLALMPKDAKIEWQVAAEEIRAALRAQGYLFTGDKVA